MRLLPDLALAFFLLPDDEDDADFRLTSGDAWKNWLRRRCSVASEASTYSPVSASPEYTGGNFSWATGWPAEKIASLASLSTPLTVRRDASVCVFFCMILISLERSSISDEVDS